MFHAPGHKTKPEAARAVSAPGAAAPRHASSVWQRAVRVQATLGNQAALRMLRSAREGAKPRAGEGVGIQAKLAVSTPGDAYEQEADAVAERVLRGENAVLAPRDTTPSVQRACAECEDEERVQRKEGPGASALVPSLHAAELHAATRAGMPLSADIRHRFEPRFGHDFSAVRVHTDAAAAASADAIGALAYTYGRDIVFASGRYAPGTPTGARLLAHELAHVVQQGSANQSGPEALHGGPVDEAWAQHTVWHGIAPDSWRSSLALPPRGVVQRACTETPSRVDPQQWQHELIQLWYKYNHGPLLREYEIPRSGTDGTTGYADLVDPAFSHIWDIAHPSDNLANKQTQVRTYVRFANQYCISGIGQWDFGTSLPPDLIPSYADPLLYVSPVLPGVLQYSYVGRYRNDATARDARGMLLRNRLRGAVGAPAPGELERWGSDVSGTDVGREYIPPGPGWRPTARDREVGEMLRTAMRNLALAGVLVANVSVLAIAMTEVIASMTAAQAALLTQRIIQMTPAMIRALTELPEPELLRTLRQMAEAA